MDEESPFENNRGIQLATTILIWSVVVGVVWLMFLGLYILTNMVVTTW